MDQNDVMNIIRCLAMYSGLTYIIGFILSTSRNMKHVRTFIQSIFLPLRMYLDKGCLMTKPSPRLAMIPSIFILMSFTVFPRNSTVNSRRPGTSFKQCRRFLLRKATDLCKMDCPLRYKRSKTLTKECSGCLHTPDITLTAGARIVLLFCLVYFAR